MRSHYSGQADLRLTILLPQPPKYWDHRCAYHAWLLSMFEEYVRFRKKKNVFLLYFPEDSGSDEGRKLERKGFAWWGRGGRWWLVQNNISAICWKPKQEPRPETLGSWRLSKKSKTEAYGDWTRSCSEATFRRRAWTGPKLHCSSPSLTSCSLTCPSTQRTDLISLFWSCWWQKEQQGSVQSC